MSKNKKRYKENILKVDEIVSYLHKINKHRITTGDKLLIKNLSDQSNKRRCKRLIRTSLECNDSTTTDVPIYNDIKPNDSNDDTKETGISHDPSDVDDSSPKYLDPKSDSDNIRIETNVNPNYQNVRVKRDFNVNLKRMLLPACMMESEIIDAAKNNDVILIFGDTGTGKSTQVPQFLYEHGFCVENTIIGVTQIRRVACIAIAQQIALELNSKTCIGYQVRYNKGYNVKSCKIKLMTDGILMNELRADLLCSKYSVIIIDEAHERRVNSDILIGILSRVVKMRRMRYNSGNHEIPPLKLVIMSATMRKEDFLESRLFENIACLHIPRNLQKCTIHYSKRSYNDYVLAARNKILQIHTLLPPGSILVFLTGKDELYRLRNILNDKHYTTPIGPALSNKINLNIGDEDDVFNLDDNYEFENISEPTADEVEEEDCDKLYQFELDVLSKRFSKVTGSEWHGSDCSGRLKVIILHASQSDTEQMESFLLPNDDERIVILSTNVAETSVTLPNIRYVIDCGKEKRKQYDIAHGVSNFIICDISKASADQRAGRTGRLGHGHCYRLYTTTTYESFENNSPLEILNSNLESALLFMSSLGITNHHSFTFLTPPPVDNINISLRSLTILGAIQLQQVTDPSYNTLYSKITTDPFKITMYYPNVCDYDMLTETRSFQITKLGKCISLIPMEPRYSKMIYSVINRGRGANYIHIAFCVVSALSFNGPIIIGSDSVSKLPSFTNDIDLLIWLCCQYSRTDIDKDELCNSYDLSRKALKEIFLQANQIYKIIRTYFSTIIMDDIDWERTIASPSLDDKRHLKETIIECLIDNVAIHNTYFSNAVEKGGYRCAGNAKGVDCVHLSDKYSKYKPECVVYNSLIGKDKVIMQNILHVDVTQLSKIKSPVIVSKNIQAKPPPTYNKENDVVEAYVERYYVPLNYYLCNIKMPLNPQHPLAIRVFAQHLCFGLIYASLSRYKSLLKVSMNDFMQPTGISSGISNMLKALLVNGVYNKRTFEREYFKNNLFLFNEYKELLKNGVDINDVLSCYKSLI